MSHGDVGSVRILLDHGADIEAGDWDTPWRHDIETNGSEREAKNWCGAPLMLATMMEDHGMMRELLAAGADPEARTSVTEVGGETALHFATNVGEESTMRVLLDNGADVNARIDDRGQLEKLARREPLSFKTRRGCLRSNEETDLFVNVQMTALEIAVWKDDAAKVSLLLGYRADPRAEVLF